MESLKIILLCVAAAIVFAIATAIFGNFAAVLAVAVFGLLIWQLVQVISRPPVYGLVLNTSGTQRDAVWSLDHSEIENLVFEITKAIGRLAYYTDIIGDANMQKYVTNTPDPTTKGATKLSYTPNMYVQTRPGLTTLPTAQGSATPLPASP